MGSRATDIWEHYSDRFRTAERQEGDNNTNEGCFEDILDGEVTASTLAAINAATNESKKVVTEITGLSQEQQQISDGMVATIRKMADITASTSALITESSAISEGLNGVSESLLQSLGQFRLSSDEPVLEITAEPSESQNIVSDTFLSPDEVTIPDQDISAV